MTRTCLQDFATDTRSNNSSEHLQTIYGCAYHYHTTRTIIYVTGSLFTIPGFYYHSENAVQQWNHCTELSRNGNRKRRQSTTTRYRRRYPADLHRYSVNFRRRE